MKIKKVDEKPMVIHTKEKAKLHTHEPKQASIKVKDYSQVDLDSEYCFIGKTDEEKSLVCMTERVPDNVIEQDNGWRYFQRLDIRKY